MTNFAVELKHRRMSILIMIAASVLPSLVLLYYIWKKDPVPEPRWWLIKSFFYGVAICSFVASLERLVSMMLFGGSGPTTLFWHDADGFPCGRCS